MPATNWISSTQKKWGCQHSRNCDVLIDQDGHIRMANTNQEEPKGKYRYAFLTDVIRGESICYNSRTFCNCVVDQKKEYDFTMVIHMKNNEEIRERVTLDQIDPIKAMISRNTYMELPKQNKIINMLNVLYVEFKVA